MYEGLDLVVYRVYGIRMEDHMEEDMGIEMET